jgi:hypothetical protein
MRRPGRLSFLLALSPRGRLEDALKTLVHTIFRTRKEVTTHSFSSYAF